MIENDGFGSIEVRQAVVVLHWERFAEALIAYLDAELAGEDMTSAGMALPAAAAAEIHTIGHELSELGANIADAPLPNDLLELFLALCRRESLDAQAAAKAGGNAAR